MGDSDLHLQKLAKYVKQLGGGGDSLEGYGPQHKITWPIRGDPPSRDLCPYSTAPHTAFAEFHLTLSEIASP